MSSLLFPLAWVSTTSSSSSSHCSIISPEEAFTDLPDVSGFNFEEGSSSSSSPDSPLFLPGRTFKEALESTRKAERAYRHHLDHLFDDRLCEWRSLSICLLFYSLTSTRLLSLLAIPLWTPSPVPLGAVGYIDGVGSFVNLVDVSRALSARLKAMLSARPFRSPKTPALREPTTASSCTLRLPADRCALFCPTYLPSFPSDLPPSFLPSLVPAPSATSRTPSSSLPSPPALSIVPSTLPPPRPSRPLTVASSIRSGMATPNRVL